KCIAAIRMLAYGSPADIVDEYARIGESTSIGAEFLRRPNNNDIDHLETWLSRYARLKIVQLHGKANFVKVIMVTHDNA
ncbi:putative nuclease HARBI1, partial [Trifolium medium]|nr:putative nuclease HARBI1 [Trifolium medium]